MRTVYREKRYVCGDYMDTYVYPVYETGPRHGKRFRHGRSTPAQARLNARHRREALTRLLHANFGTQDWELHVTYADLPDEDDARRELTNFLRRLRRAYARQGIPLKYIAVTERGVRSGRFHHHITINGGGLEREALEALWNRGHVCCRHLRFNDQGLSALAGYLSKGHAGYKAWSCSRNLVRPAPRTRDGRLSARAARAWCQFPQAVPRHLYPGYALVDFQGFQNDVNGGFYLFARFVKIKRPGICPRP